MALSDKDILKHRKLGNIIIEPFSHDNLATSSYDVRLGEWYFREQRQNFDVYNPYDKDQTDKVWGTEPHKAQLAKNSLKDFEFKGIKPTDKIILISPGETILAHTEEYLGGKNEITTMMKARSSMGRNFIEVCKCAGWGDVGYTNRWTMEITNNSRFYTIPLVVGRRIAQIIFFHVGPVQKDDYTRKGKYQNTNTLSKMKKEWSPLSMLPKLYNDREIKKR
jgi:dCTP deaminase